MSRPLRTVIALIFVCSLVPEVLAQSGRASGAVRDSDDRPVRGATIRAIHPEVDWHVVSTSDSRGNWAMLGLQPGTYTFVVEAPGFVPVQGAATIRTTTTDRIVFRLQREPGPPAGALPSNIQAQIAAATMLRDEGRIDEAIAAFETIRNRHPKLTAVNFVIAAAYRRKAAVEPEPRAKRAALGGAADGYNRILEADPLNDRARGELALVEAEMAALQH